MDAVIYNFGTDYITYACDQHIFRINATVAVGTVFYNWIFGFRVRVKYPQENVKEWYERLVLVAAEEV